MKLHNTIIYLIGIPAVGKYTVGREIARLTGARLVDNQLINYPVFSVIGYDGTDTFPFPQAAWQHIEVIHKQVLAVIRDLCPPDASFVFTNVLDANDPDDKVWFRRIERLAKHRQAKFFPVWLTCDAATLRRRKDAPERKARLKDIDLTSIPRWLEEFAVLKVPHPHALTLDTARATPTQTAKRILNHVRAIESRAQLARHGNASDDA
jgi:predicted kinase